MSLIAPLRIMLIVDAVRDRAMQFFEILCITLGMMNGATMALLPDPMDSKRPLGAILAFSVAFALATFFLPVIVSSPRFVMSLALTLAGAAISFFAVRALLPKTKLQVQATQQKQPVLGTMTPQA